MKNVIDRLTFDIKVSSWCCTKHLVCWVLSYVNLLACVFCTLCNSLNKCLLLEVAPVDPYLTHKDSLCIIVWSCVTLQDKLSVTALSSHFYIFPFLALSFLFLEQWRPFFLIKQIKPKMQTYFFFFCVPQLYFWGSPFLGEIFVYVTVFLIQPLR